MTMAELKSVEKYTFNISVQMAVICILFIIAVGWQGSTYYNGIMFGQQTSTTLILSKIDGMAREQKMRDKAQSDSLKIAFDTNTQQAQVNISTGTSIQQQVDVNRRVENRLSKVESITYP